MQTKKQRFLGAMALLPMALMVLYGFSLWKAPSKERIAVCSAIKKSFGERPDFLLDYRQGLELLESNKKLLKDFPGSDMEALVTKREAMNEKLLDGQNEIGQFKKTGYEPLILSVRREMMLRENEFPKFEYDNAEMRQEISAQARQMGLEICKAL